jgi:phospho-N-acetylmuramoyl-pentapeptide-transferase
MIWGRKLIEILRGQQVLETVRDLGIPGEKEKANTPMMGGLIIIAAIVVPTLLFARIDSTYVILMLVATIWLGAMSVVMVIITVSGPLCNL